MRHALCQVLKHGNKPSDSESSYPCYYSQIEGLGLHVVYITRYVIRIKKHSHNRIKLQGIWIVTPTHRLPLLSFVCANYSRENFYVCALLLSEVSNNNTKYGNSVRYLPPWTRMWPLRACLDTNFCKETRKSTMNENQEKSKAKWNEKSHCQIGFKSVKQQIGCSIFHIYTGKLTVGRHSASLCRKSHLILISHVCKGC